MAEYERVTTWSSAERWFQTEPVDAAATPTSDGNTGGDALDPYDPEDPRNRIFAPPMVVIPSSCTPVDGVLSPSIVVSSVSLATNRTPAAASQNPTSDGKSARTTQTVNDEKGSSAVPLLNAAENPSPNVIASKIAENPSSVDTASNAAEKVSPDRKSSAANTDPKPMAFATSIDSIVLYCGLMCAVDVTGADRVAYFDFQSGPLAQLIAEPLDRLFRDGKFVDPQVAADDRAVHPALHGFQCVTVPPMSLAKFLGRIVAYAPDASNLDRIIPRLAYLVAELWWLWGRRLPGFVFSAHTAHRLVGTAWTRTGLFATGEARYPAPADFMASAMVQTLKDSPNHDDIARLALVVGMKPDELVRSLKVFSGLVREAFVLDSIYMGALIAHAAQLSGLLRRALVSRRPTSALSAPLRLPYTDLASPQSEQESSGASVTTNAASNAPPFIPAARHIPDGLAADD